MHAEIEDITLHSRNPELSPLIWVCPQEKNRDIVRTEKNIYRIWIIYEVHGSIQPPIHFPNRLSFVGDAGAYPRDFVNPIVLWYKKSHFCIRLWKCSSHCHCSDEVGILCYRKEPQRKWFWNPGFTTGIFWCRKRTTVCGQSWISCLGHAISKYWCWNIFVSDSNRIGS